MRISTIIAEIYNYIMYNGLVIIKFNSYYIKGSEIIKFIAKILHLQCTAVLK